MGALGWASCGFDGRDDDTFAARPGFAVGEGDISRAPDSRPPADSVLLVPFLTVGMVMSPACWFCRSLPLLVVSGWKVNRPGRAVQRNG